MNERIKELADQAEDYADADDKFPYPSVAWLSTFKEKFAELIVKECVAICEDTDGEHIADAKWGRRCCALEMKQHFGVEE
jgi:hypothetical protein